MLEYLRKRNLSPHMNNSSKIAARYFAAPLVVAVIIVSWLYGKQSPQDAREGERLPFSSQSGQARESAHKVERDNHTSKYIDLLLATPDTQIRRDIRGEIALLKPAHETVRLLVKHYLVTSNEEEKIQLLSVIAQIDPTGSIEDIYAIASEAEDAPLFVSLVYCLGEANTKESKLALLKLAGKSQLMIAESATEKKDQGLSAIARILLDNIEPSDGPWLGDFLKASTSNDAQVSIVVAAAANHPSLEMEQVLRDASEAQTSPELMKLTQRELELMRSKLEAKTSEPSKAKLRERPPLPPGQQ